VESNAVFLKLPKAMDDFLESRGWKYYHFIEGGARFMCSWQTSAADVDALVTDMKEASATGLFKPL